MKKNRIILSLAVVLWLTSSVSAATIDRIAVRSEAMKKEISVVVIVPDAAKSGVRMPVLYLLHGYSGDQETWLNVKPSLPQKPLGFFRTSFAPLISIIVVIPFVFRNKQSSSSGQHCTSLRITVISRVGTP